MYTYFSFLWVWVINAWHDYWSALLHPHFDNYVYIFFLPVLLLAVAVWGRRQLVIRHSTLAPHENMTGLGGLKSKWSLTLALAYLCLGLAVTNVNLAAMGPTVPQARVEHIVQQREVCAAFDSSGSMTTVLQEGMKDIADDEAKAKNDPTAVTVDNRGSDKLYVQGKKKDEPPHPMTRAEGGQLAARYLVRHRMNDDPLNTDRFCMFRFDMDSYMMVPLTSDKIVVTLRTAHITENVGGGTNFAGLSDSGIGILQKYYDYFTTQTKSTSVRVAILVTDGYDAIDPQRRKELIALYKEAHILLYVIGLGEGWKEGNTLDLQKFADELHAADPHSGIVFRASNPGQMQKAMEEIDSREKALEQVESLETYRQVDYAFISLAVFLILLYFAFATLARRIP